VLIFAKFICVFIVDALAELLCLLRDHKNNGTDIENNVAFGGCIVVLLAFFEIGLMIFGMTTMNYPLFLIQLIRFIPRKKNKDLDYTAPDVKLRMKKGLLISVALLSLAVINQYHFQIDWVSDIWQIIKVNIL